MPNGPRSVFCPTRSRGNAFPETENRTRGLDSDAFAMIEIGNRATITIARPCALQVGRSPDNRETVNVATSTVEFDRLYPVRRSSSYVRGSFTETNRARKSRFNDMTCVRYRLNRSRNASEYRPRYVYACFCVREIRTCVHEHE